ncbi:hypothetical protein [Neotabrizicola sp. sgz301269]|uniref:hypothetical protein n=1 Tax=Neotabrizicola sp. sgz301269 TaxID=3276282 RepID=UPI00377041E4
MPKYLNPAYAEFLDMMLTPTIGFKVHFWKYAQNEVETSIAAAANRVDWAVKDAIKRISRIASDVTKTVPMQHEASRQIYDRLAEHVAKDIAYIRDKADKDAAAARDRAFAPIAADPDKTALYAETRAIFRDMAAKADPSWPVEASRLVKSNRDIAAALNAAPAFNSGLTDDRWSQLIQTAVVEFAPDDAAAMVHAVEVGAEASKIEAGMAKLKAAAYDTAQSNKARETFVDAEAPFAVPPAEAAE